MMNKMRSAKAHLLKFLFILPLAAVLLLAFRSRTGGAGNNNGPQLLLQEHSSAIAIDTPPPPPPVPPVPTTKLPKNVKSISATNNKTVVTLKDGTKEYYDLDVPEEKINYEKKYGKLPAPPPPPMVLPAGTSTLPAPPPPPMPPTPATAPGNVTITDVAVTSEPVVAVSLKPTVSAAVITSVDVSSKAEGISTAAVTTPVAVHTSIDNLASTHVSPVKVTMNTKVFEIKVYRSTSRAKLDLLIEDAKAQGITLEFDKASYNSNNELVSLAGKATKGSAANAFNAADFEVVTIALVKNGNRDAFEVVISQQAEEI